MEFKEASERSKRVIEDASLMIEKYYGRGAGSESEASTQKEFLERLKKLPHSWDAHEETFRVSSYAFLSFDPMLGGFSSLSILLWWLELPWAAWASSHFAILIALLEFGLYKQFVDPFFPTKISRNVMARIAPQFAVSRRIIIGGHADSAFHWRINPHYIILWFMHFIQFSSAFVVLGTTYISPSNHRTTVFICIHSVCAFCLLTTVVNTNFRKTVDGANDNMSGTLVALELAEFFANESNRLQRTEAVVLITGSEEAGLRGAKAFAKAHEQELVGTCIDTVFLGFETLAEREALAVAHEEMNGLIKCDQRVVELHEHGMYQGCTSCCMQSNSNL